METKTVLLWSLAGLTVVVIGLVVGAFLWNGNGGDKSAQLLALHKHQKATLVFAFAPWCGTCKKVKPVMERLRKQHGPQIIKFYNWEVQADKLWFKRNNKRFVPVIGVLNSSGNLFDTLSGPKTEATIVTFAKKHGVW